MDRPIDATTLRATDLRGDEPAWQALIDCLDCGLVVYDAVGRLVLCNDGFRRLYRPIATHIAPGLRFEDLLRLALDAGLVPQAAGDEAGWVARRAAQFGAGAPIERRMPDGRWRRITEQRLADGGVLSYSIDITEGVLQRQALQRALEDAQQSRDWLEDAIEALPAGFELWDKDDRLVLSNSELARMYPRIAAALQPGASFQSLVRANHAAGGLPVPAAEIEAYIERQRTQRQRASQPTDHDTGDGQRYRVYHRPTRQGGLVGVRMDVTELHRERAAAEQARRDAEAARLQLSEGIEALPDGFALYDADDRLVVCNARYRELYSASASVLQPGVRFEDVLRYGLSQGQYPQADGREEPWLQERLRDHRQPQGPVIQELPGNRWLRIDERITSDGGIAGVRTEVTELVRHQQQLTRLNQRLSEANARVELLSETDAVTGIANRRRFDRRLAEEWGRVASDRAALGLLLVDIDDFKAFNDRHGHQAGDDCLKRVAAVLAACASRPTDVVARYGGEEFAILLPHTGRSDLMHLAQRCVAAVDAAAIEHGASRAAPHLTISVGAAFADGNADAARLLRAADAALYRAKAAGRRRAEMADGAI
jgi:diguanylate cyclase (GGDEF)-like protein